MLSSSSLTLPAWFQWTLGIMTILWALGGAAFALFVLWPSIRKSNRVADKILSGGLTGPAASRDEFAGRSSEGDL